MTSNQKFVDYFVISGLDINSGLEPDQLSGDSLHCSPLDRPYKSRILAHYPEKVLANVFDPEAVCMLCHPNGLRFKTQRDKREARFHSFVITKEDGCRVYGATLTFYEQVDNAQICGAMQTLQDMHQAELSNAQSRALYAHFSSSHSAASGLQTAPSSPAHRSSPTNQSPSRGYATVGRTPRKSSRSPAGDSAHGGRGSRGHASSASPAPRMVRSRTYHQSRDVLYAAKCVCVVARVPFVDAFQRFLTSLYALASVSAEDSLQQQLSIASYVYNVIHETTIPQPGCSLRITAHGGAIDCQRPGLSELPLLDYPLRRLFDLLSVDNVLTVFTSILLEHQILFCSEDFQRLMLVAEGLTTLIFPFQWQHVYVPLLPASLHHFLDAPVPFIMGLQGADIDAVSKATMCIVDIDAGAVEKPEDLSSFPYHAQLKQDLEQELRRHASIGGGGAAGGGVIDANGGNQRDSGFVRDSFVAPGDFRVSTAMESPSDSSSVGQSGSSTASVASVWGGNGGASTPGSGAGGSGVVGSGVGSSSWSLSARMEMLGQNEALARVTALARRSGVVSSMDDIRDSVTDAAISAHRLTTSPSSGPGGSGAPGGASTPPRRTGPLPEHARDLIFNSSVREIFLHYLLHVFGAYERFVVMPTVRDVQSWASGGGGRGGGGGESTQNFDKTAFLSDHAAEHLLFLSPFTETQMFASFIDAKILSLLEKAEREGAGEELGLGGGGGAADDGQLAVFDARLGSFREEQSDQRLRRFYRTAAAKEAETLIEKRATIIDQMAPAPRQLGEPAESRARPGFFPLLSAAILNKEPKTTQTKSQRAMAMYGIPARSEQKFEMRNRYLKEAQGLSRLPKPVSRQPSLDINPKAMVNANWKFMEALLKECKVKTLRMLLQKMGQEAVDLGHRQVTEVEENMLIGSLCDLLDRIWSHGLQQKQRDVVVVLQRGSALWFHLISFQAADQMSRQNQQSHDAKHLTSGQSLEGGSEEDCTNGTHTWPMRHHRRKPSRGPELPILDPLPISVLADVTSVRNMSDIKTDVGYSRAFVRLSLEKKLLSKHLKELLANSDLLRSVYKRYAFLRCEDEREQFLYHLLSLNAVDYFCFTNTFTTTMIPYRILVFPRMKLNGSTTTANCWVSLAGQLGETKQIDLSKHSLDITVSHKNLGVLTTMRIGHDNAGISPKWMVEHVLVRNETTGQTYRFPCGRWLGRGADDGALERLLVAELVPPTVDANELVERCRTPPRCRSPSVPRRSSEPRLLISEVHEQLREAVNNLLKHLEKSRLDKERGGSVTGLLCGESGLVICMEHVFQYGFKSSRLFRGRVFIWDFLERVVQCLEQALLDREHYNIVTEVRRTISSLCHVVTSINHASESIGKDERFQIFVCIGVRDRMLQKWLRIIHKTSVTVSMFEEHSFVRDATLLDSVIVLLDILSESTITLESSLIKGVKV